MTATGLSFSVVDITPEPYAVSPVLIARVAVSVPGDEPVHALALRCQVRIDPLRRRYSDEEAAGLADLFGPRERWATTQHTFLWQHCATMVPQFVGTTEVPLPLACTYDFQVAADKYLHALREGSIQLQFLFSGMVFTAGGRGFSVRPVPDECEDRYSMPVSVWWDLMRQHFPNSGWIRLDHDTVAALTEYKSRRGLLNLDDAVTALLAATHEEVR